MLRIAARLLVPRIAARLLVPRIDARLLLGLVAIDGSGNSMGFRPSRLAYRGEKRRETEKKARDQKKRRETNQPPI